MTQTNILKITLLILLSLSSSNAEEIVKDNNTTTVPVQITPQKIIEVIKDTNTTQIPAPTIKEELPDANLSKKIAPILKKEEILEKKASNDIRITMPPIPVVPVVTTKVPKLIILDSNGNLIEKDSMDGLYKKKEIIFSKNVAPARFNESYGQRTEKVLVGDIENGRVAAYLHTDFMSVKDVEEKLKTAGFDILASFKVDKKATATSIVFTNAAMQKGASQIQRGFAAALRITVDKKNKLLSISNPIYLMKAFMQKEYDKELAVATLKTLRDTFSNLKNSTELVKFNVLARFHFMENMPYYHDMKIVSEATNEELLKRVKKSKQLVFEQHLDNGSILLGVKLKKRTSKFVKKIGYQNAGLLPYPVLIEKGKAYIMAPQYYIAIMYPDLKMGQFMKISTVPGAIAKDIDRIFR